MAARFKFKHRGSDEHELVGAMLDHDVSPSTPKLPPHSPCRHCQTSAHPWDLDVDLKTLRPFCHTLRRLPEKISRTPRKTCSAGASGAHLQTLSSPPASSCAHVGSSTLSLIVVHSRTRKSPCDPMLFTFSLGRRSPCALCDGAVETQRPARVRSRTQRPPRSTL